MMKPLLVTSLLAISLIGNASENNIKQFVPSVSDYVQIVVDDISMAGDILERHKTALHEQHKSNIGQIEICEQNYRNQSFTISDEKRCLQNVLTMDQQLDTEFTPSYIHSLMTEFDGVITPDNLHPKMLAIFQFDQLITESKNQSSNIEKRRVIYNPINHALMPYDDEEYRLFRSQLDISQFDDFYTYYQAHTIPVGLTYDAPIAMGIQSKLLTELGSVLNPQEMALLIN